jgi:hypothetical protein
MKNIKFAAIFSLMIASQAAQAIVIARAPVIVRAAPAVHVSTPSVHTAAPSAHIPTPVSVAKTAPIPVTVAKAPTPVNLAKTAVSSKSASTVEKNTAMQKNVVMPNITNTAIITPNIIGNSDKCNEKEKNNKKCKTP